jgi:hypothetical protein
MTWPPMAYWSQGSEWGIHPGVAYIIASRPMWLRVLNSNVFLHFDQEFTVSCERNEILSSDSSSHQLLLLFLCWIIAFQIFYSHLFILVTYCDFQKRNFDVIVLWRSRPMRELSKFRNLETRLRNSSERYFPLPSLRSTPCVARLRGNHWMAQQ